MQQFLFYCLLRSEVELYSAEQLIYIALTGCALCSCEVAVDVLAIEVVCICDDVLHHYVVKTELPALCTVNAAVVGRDDGCIVAEVAICTIYIEAALLGKISMAILELCIVRMAQAARLIADCIADVDTDEGPILREVVGASYLPEGEMILAIRLAILE